MATIETIKTQKERVKSWPYPPAFKTLKDVNAYLVKLYVALSENTDKGFSGEIFVSHDSPQSFMGKDGDLWVKKSE